MSPGKLVILSGPSGVGKDTVIDAWARRNPRVARVVAYTTRAPRAGEVNGTDYHFVEVDAFKAKSAKGDFLEFKEVHGNFYATPLTDMEAMLAIGLIAILKIDVQGALSVMALRPEAMTVFLLPPSDAELEARIRGRGTESEEVISKRLRNAREEIALSGHYQHRLVNMDVEETVDALEQLTS